MIYLYIKNDFTAVFSFLFVLQLVQHILCFTFHFLTKIIFLKTFKRRFLVLNIWKECVRKDNLAEIFLLC